ncbi:MAG: Flp pilus assembly protein CpaB [Bdellovibrio sp.]|nr:MAG: Flp pilus assembly protein CpaB [Bdellovibrio sp.]
MDKNRLWHLFKQPVRRFNKVNKNETRTLWLSIGAALIAVFLLYSYTQEKSDALNKKFGAKQKVVIAKKDIGAMNIIDDSYLDVVERPVAYVEPNAIKNPEEVVGHVALAPILAGEQILKSKVIEPGPVTGLSLQVAPGKRALTLPVDEMRGVAKLLKPGDRIDIIAALDVGEGLKQHREIKTLLQNVPVLATGQVVVNDLPLKVIQDGEQFNIKPYLENKDFSSITVEVSPSEAQKLIFILSTSPSSLFLTLRHPSDQKRYPLPVVKVEDLQGRAPASLLRKQFVSPPVLPKPVKKPVKKKKRRGPFEDL